MGETAIRKGRRSLPVLVACLALLAAGCGDDEKDSGSKPAGGAATAKEAVKVNIASFKFVPDPIKLKAGGTVTWVNQDKAPHTAQTEAEVKPGFDTDRLNLSDKKAIKLEKPGKFAYFCVYHRFMEGTVEVVE